MKNSELQKMKIQTEQGVFFPAYTYSNKIDIKNKNGEVVDYEYVDFILYKTAEEVYQEYLNPKPVEQKIDKDEYQLDLDFRVTMIELGMI